MQPSCRICLEDSAVSDLIQPCQCKGSIRYVHRRCLNEWRAVSQKRNSFFSCELCNASYYFSDQGRRRSHVRYFAIGLMAPVFCGIVVGSGYIMKIVELFLTQDFPAWKEFLSIDKLHVIYGVLLPAAFGLGPFCSVINIGTPHILNLALNGFSLDSITQFMLEVIVFAIGIIIGLSRILSWTYERTLRKLERVLLDESQILDLQCRGSHIKHNE
uniref:RING-CH-type domain-containing protein n=1 Tax=Spongospora subterranea TaxID=70186 RepID=A0A0H5QZX1_9EUKA|eukprot:CRZ07242.1 hypothetical protein [Spongospora subterranea]